MKKTKKNLNKGLYTTAVLAAMVVAPYVAEEVVGMEGVNLFENKASALEGAGTESSPYIVSTAAELTSVMSNVSTKSSVTTYIELAADIDLTGRETWTAQGTSSKPVYVHFDGKGHTIKGLRAIDAYEDYVGFIGHMKLSTVENVVFENPTVSAADYGGVVAGKATDGVIRNVTVKNASVSSDKYSGGIVGQAITNTKLENLSVIKEASYTNSAEIFASNGYSGGIAGSYTVASSDDVGLSPAKGLYVNAGVRAGDDYVGGIFGEVKNSSTSLASTIYDVVADGYVKGWSYMGGIAGKASNVIIQGGAAYNNVENLTSYNSKDYVGGLVGSLVGAKSSLNLFIANEQIKVDGTNGGLAFGHTSTAALKTTLTAKASTKFQGTTLNTFGVNTTFASLNTMEEYFTILSETYKGEVQNGFSHLYFDVNTKKLTSVKLASDEAILNSIASSEYQNAIKTLKSDAINKFNRGLTGYSSVLGSMSTNTVVNSYESYIGLTSAMDTQANKSRMDSLISPLTASQGLLAGMGEGWQDSGNSVSAVASILRDKEIGSLFVNSTVGRNWINNYLTKYKSGSYGSYATSAEYVSWLNALDSLRATPTQKNYDEFAKRTKLIKNDANTEHVLISLGEYYKKANNLKDYVDTTLEDARIAVEKAEQTPNQANLNDARSKVELVSDVKQKEAFTARLVVVEAAVQAAIEAEKAAIEAAKAVSAATQAVVKAESTNTETDLEAARNLVNNLPKGTDKTSLTERLDAVEAKILAIKNPSGEGTYDNPYVVTSVIQFISAMNLAYNEHPYDMATIHLATDIDLSGINWQPLGTTSKPMDVSIYGNGHTIKNLTVNSTSNYQGLVGYADYIHVNGVTFESPNIKGGSYVGVVAGQAKIVELNKVEVNNPTVHATGKYAGGIAGLTNEHFRGWHSISEASEGGLYINGGNIFAAGGYAGGLTGSSTYSAAEYGSIYINEVFVNTNVSSNGSYVGGLFGEYTNTSSTEKSFIYDVVVDGSVKGASYVGGIAGKWTNQDVVSTIAYNSVEATTSGGYVGGLFGQVAGNLEIRGFVANSSITGVGSNVGLVYGYGSNPNLGYATADTKWQGTSLKKEHVGSFEDLTDVNNLYRITSNPSHLVRENYPAEMMWFANTYFDAKTQKVRAIATSTDAEVINAFSSNEYQTAIQALKQDVINRLNQNLKGAEALKGYSINATAGYDIDSELRAHMDSFENVALAEKALSGLFASRSLLNSLSSNWTDSTGLKADVNYAFRDKEIGTAYVYSQAGDTYINSIVSSYKNGNYGAYEGTKISVAESFEQFKANPTQAGYNYFKTAAKLDAAQTNTWQSNDARKYLEAVAEFLKEANGLGDYVDTSYPMALAAVEKAEQTPNEANLNDARSKVTLVTNVTQKNELTARLDVVEAIIEATKALNAAKDAVTKAESTKTQADVDTARTLVNALPNSTDKTTLGERLDAVQNAIDLAAKIAQATQAVVKAEGSKAQADVDSARTLVNALPDGADKTALNKRLDAVQNAIDLAAKVAVATQAVVKAEGSKAQTDVDSARTLVNALPDGADKTALNERLDAIQVEIDKAKAEAEKKKAIDEATQAVVKAEGSKAQADVDTARTLVNALPDGADKTALNERLDVVQAAIDLAAKVAVATQAVVKAEGSKAQTDVDDARILVNALPDGADKAALTERLDAIQVEIDKAKAEAEKQKALEEATQAVVKAEGSKTQADVDTARTLVNALPDSADKTALTERLDTVQKAIDDAKALEEATQAVVKAEGTKTQADVDTARTLVNALPDGADKTALTERLDAVQTEIDKAKAEAEKQKALEEATQAVVKAETTKTQVDVDNARILVNNLPDGADKTALTERLDAVQAEIDKIASENAELQAAKEAVSKAETTKTQSDVDNARALVNELSDGADKTALNERLDKVQAEIDNAKQQQEALEKATQAVVKAEGSKSQEDVDDARILVNALPDGADKTALNERLDAIQAEIDNAKSEAEKQKAIDEATQAVVKAEGTKAQADVDDARTLVNALPDGADKTALNERLDAIQAEIDNAKSEAEKQKALEEATQAVVKAEGSKTQTDVDVAQDLVNKLPDGSDKDALQERLDKVQAEIDNAKQQEEALEKATQAVVKAEGSKSQEDVDNARTLVNALPDGADKTALNERLDKVQAEIDKAKAEDEKQQALDEATQAVVKAEGTKEQTDVNNARTLVNVLPNGEDKTALNERLDAVQKAIDEAKEAEKENQLIALATQAVEKAEKDRDSRSIFSAKLTVAKLKEGDIKDALNARIKAVEDANEYERLVKVATKAVERAEVSKTAKDIASARTQVNNLPDGDVKTELTKRIDAIEQYDPAYESAKKLVEIMEIAPNDKNINNAQNAVDKVVNEAKKAELQARIDAVKAELNEKALEAATKLVVEAEKAKTSISVINAQKAIDGLIPSAEKTALQERLDVVKAEIQKMNEDLSTFVVDEEVLAAIDDIQNKEDRDALKAWRIAVERGEKYFSFVMVGSIEKSIPSAEILNNPEYALIVHQLQARYDSLLLGGKEYSYVYQMMIRSAYDAVLEFEAKPSQSLKDTALKAIEVVNTTINPDNVFITVLKARVLNVKF